MHRFRNATFAAVVALAGTALGGCSAEDTTEPPAFEPVFSLVVIADSHISTNPDNEQRLSAAVDWINTNAAERQIELVVVLGDIGWGSGLGRAKQLLDVLDVPYVPLIGDNEIHEQDDEAFAVTFGPQYDELATVLVQWRKAPTPIWHPRADNDVWLQNMAFTHRGIHFFGLDWCVRDAADDMAVEFGDLNDYDGGSWPWFQQQIEQTPAAVAESIILLSHIPMMIGLFDVNEMAAFADLLGPRRDSVYANLAGHVHGELNWSVDEAGYTVYTTDATWDDDNTVRVVRVDSNGLAFAYVHELVVVP